MRTIEKLLVCNRGEIAIRIFRACVELGIRTVAIYSYEDRFSLHRSKADEAYQVGEEGSPVAAYLDIPGIIAIAKEKNVDAIHPGYGFLAERAELRRAAEEAGILFVGPSIEALEVAGDKVKTRALAEELDIPLVPGSSVIGSIKEAEKFAEQVGYPLMFKASYGGGGRGMRLVKEASQLESEFLAAQNEAEAAFGVRDVFLEKYVSRPKHLEVQLLGDSTGDVIHLFERDCSVQRRHQKVIEYAPAIGVSSDVKESLYRYAVLMGKGLGLRCAATAEFLLSESDEIFFIEVNPRVQVEHTVTEEVTGVDIVQSQIRLAAGESLASLGLTQESLTTSGVAVQCRITTEDPAKDFQPDYGRLIAYRSASGFGIRLDAGSAFAGATISPYYDSLLVKVTACRQSMLAATRCLTRALREFRIRGVKTNIPFVENLLAHPQFVDGGSRTDFLEVHPEIFDFRPRANRANRLLRFLAEVTVNGHEHLQSPDRPLDLRDVQVPPVDRCVDGVVEKKGWRDELLSLGNQRFLEKVYSEKALLITDTTFRDAHQSLLATRVRTVDMLKVAKPLSQNAPELFSLEMWGGATFDVMLRYLREDPWERLSLLREEIPNILFQMLIRGANAVGYSRYPSNVVKEFVREAHQAGIDIFRAFDCFNNLPKMRTAIDAAKESGALAEVCLCYTGDLAREEVEKNAGRSSKFDLEYYLQLARSFKEAGADIIAIKDMAGLLRPYAAKLLVKSLREETGLPIHFHTHDTAGGQVASYLAAAEAGVDIVDCAFSSMSGLTSQPSLEAVSAALANSERDPGLDLQQMSEFSNYWDGVRRFYVSFESDLKAATSEVYLNEIPGGQYSNFRPQAMSLGLGDKWAELKAAYREVNELFGGIVKVTPSSKVVGDLALFMLANNLTAQELVERADTLDFPTSVIDFFLGKIGEPYGGFPADLQKAVLRGKMESVVSEELPASDFEAAKADASELLGRAASIRDALSFLLYPQVFEQYADATRQYGNTMLLPTLCYFYGLEEGEEVHVDIEEGKRLYIKLLAVSEPEDDGKRTVFFELNGQPRSIRVVDRSLGVEVQENPKADSSNPNHVSAPLSGLLVKLEVGPDERVEKGDPLFALEAMKMQTLVTANDAGVVKEVHLRVGDRVEVGDLVVELA